MLEVYFPVAGVSVPVYLPPLVAFFLAFFGSMGGVTGAFLLLPFQMSVLGYNAPGVSATNFTYNVINIPGSVWSYVRSGRMNWMLAGVITAGTLPGLILGYYLRVTYLTDPASFRPFVGVVLLGLAALLVRRLYRSPGKSAARAALPSGVRVEEGFFTFKRAGYRFGESRHEFDPRLLIGVALLVGIVGGAYGIGGGALLSPFCIAVLRLPVHTTAGATLFGTFVASILGVGIYHLGLFSPGIETRADYLLGSLFGLGGLLGATFGARLQRYVPEKPIQIGLLIILLFVAVRYLASPFL